MGTKRKDVRQVHSDHRQLAAGPAGCPPAGWRRLEDRGRWQLERGGQGDQGHPGVGRGEEGTNSPIADVFVVWAQTEGGLRGFILEKGMYNQVAGTALARPQGSHSNEYVSLLLSYHIHMNNASTVSQPNQQAEVSQGYAVVCRINTTGDHIASY